ESDPGVGESRTSGVGGRSGSWRTGMASVGVGRSAGATSPIERSTAGIDPLVEPQPASNSPRQAMATRDGVAKRSNSLRLGIMLPAFRLLRRLGEVLDPLRGRRRRDGRCL